MKIIGTVNSHIKSFDFTKLWKRLLKMNPTMYNKYIELYGLLLQGGVCSLNKAFEHFILIQDLKKEDRIAKLQELIESELAASKGMNLERSSMKHIPKRCDFRNKPSFKNEQLKESTVVGERVLKGVAERAVKRAKIIEKAQKKVLKRKMTTRNK